MAHKKGVGSSKNGRDSNSKRLGVKIYGGQQAIAGNIIIRQRGTKYHPGEHMGMGKDHTLYALIDGQVSFRTTRKDRTYVSILPEAGWVAPAPKVKKAKKVKEEAPAAEAPKAKAKKEKAPKAEKAAAPKAEAPTEKVEAPAPKVEAAAPAPSVEAEDLKKIEGIGPKIAEILNTAGILSFRQLAETTPDAIRALLEEAGPRYKAHNPATWPKQAEMAAEGKWDELKKWQDELDGGKA